VINKHELSWTPAPVVRVGPTAPAGLRCVGEMQGKGLDEPIN
jgi:hypothetical protein